MRGLCGLNRGQICEIFFLTATVAIISIFTFHHSSTISFMRNHRRHINIKRLDDDVDVRGVREELQYTPLPINHSNPLTILIWNYPSGSKFPPIFHHCGPCAITTNRKMAAKSHAIVIDFHEIDKLPSPATRRSDQIYVWMCSEATWTTKHLHHIELPSALDDYFNATMTYRRDSEIQYPYLAMLHRYQPLKHAGRFIRFLNNDVSSVIANKNGLALWLVRNCHHTFGARYRFNYVMGLVKAGLDITVYGRCFGNEKRFPRFRSVQSLVLMSSYKFYISFENAYHCRDYITEKFWLNAIYSGAVPIVWGPSVDDLKALAPPNSFINAEEFGNDTEKLVRYIKFLDKNPSEYRKYFQWRFDLQMIDKFLTLKEKSPSNFVEKSLANLTARFSNYKLFLKNKTVGFCDLCHAMHTGRSKTFRPIKSMDQWWYGSERPVCLKGVNFSKKKE